MRWPFAFNKRVVLIDDSIVRGTTSGQIVRSLLDAGAREVHFLVSSPPIKFPDFYGIDIPTRAELIAATKTVEEIRAHMGADILMYQDIDDLTEAVTRRGDHGIDRLSMPCLDGWYVTGDITEERMREMEATRTPERDEMKI